MYRMYTGNIQKYQRYYHEKYGPIIRIAPNEVAVADPTAVSKIYPLQKPNQKTDWYTAWRPSTLDSRTDLFTELDEKTHTAYRRIVGSAYGLTSVLKNEESIDAVLTLFLKRVGEFADRKEAFDFGKWLEMFAFENVGTCIFGKQFGFLEKKEDHGGYINAVHTATPFLGIITVTPTYMRPFVGPVALFIPKLLKAIMAFDGIRVTALKELDDAVKRSEEDTAKRNDFMSQFLSIVHDRGEKVNFTIKEVSSEAWVAVTAGADSTSILLRTVFYKLMQNPRVLNKLRAEIDEAFESGALSHPVQYAALDKLPYLNAVIKECTRIFPSFQVTMPRHAPAEGLELCGYHIPAGYRAGMNPAVVLFNKEVFGEDAREFRPERWQESEARNHAMDKAMINFGAGTRTCIGRNLALAQAYKVSATILREFTFEMAHDRPWQTYNAGFRGQYDVICNLRRRTLA
ncbi:hypothetical protein N0V90_008037 [Kalmusia sp. IMI 367209]|nr:hypothetical protein N0V90_008037 [Kalmusia sp. IMI 367209]